LPAPRAGTNRLATRGPFNFPLHVTAAKPRTAIFLGLLVVAFAVRGDGTPCPADRHDERVISAQIFDGDTLALVDGRRVRLLGINTPEIGHDGAPSEAYAEEAKKLLARRAGPGTRLHLRLDSERFDRYGRLLAHVFTDNGDNLQVLLLEAGFATTLVVPPNEWSRECYSAAQARARGQGDGIWSLARYQPIPAEDLADTTRGYRLVTGRVQRIGESRGNVWLNLSRRMAIRIPRDDLIYFGDRDPRSLAGRRLEVRGWVSKRRGELRITVRHPSALTILD
jgi:endonuclease YncB( thermonuclease family)